MDKSTEYPIPSFRFTVTIDSEIISCQEVTGLEQEVSMIEYRTGDHPKATKMKVPGIQKTSNVTLKKGVYREDTFLFDWFNEVKDLQNTGDFTEAKKQVVISLMGQDGDNDIIISWKLENAFPIKITAPSLNGGDDNIAIESVEIAHEGLTIEA
ncbi:phage tail protein [Flammeovirga pacifica]|uniref:Phage tail protein n=1 Tax=Flammeovirga pacifica TaxID=915059 RepID=A0A1S1YVB4_FLAPC|nr:phage tail protein [Flammeovirga pacifica]OHX64962.1 hypothetical protein NH26_00665 [Flammeovirga pacifica]